MDTGELENALEKRSKNRWWLCTVFILASSPGIFNSMHITSYVFLSGNPKFWCDIPELRKANWTDEEIRNISAIDPQGEENCLMYNWNYKYFEQIGFKEAFNYVQNNKKPTEIKCTSYRYEEDYPTIVDEWDLVCEYTPLKSVAQVAVALGKFLGAFVFGMFADRFGRKKCFVSSCILYIFSGPIAGFAPTYYLFLIMRLLIGIAGSGVYESGYTIITELTVKGHRTRLGCLYNISYSIGLMILPILAYYSNNWRQLQYYLSFPAIILLIHCWFLPESPRWLITQGRIEEAKKIIYGKSRNDINLGQTNEVPGHAATEGNQNNEVNGVSHPWYKRLFSAAQRLLKIYATSELRKRIIICYFGWFVASMCYFVIALNAHNFTANKYWYVALNGLSEAPGYFLPLFVLAFVGRKVTGISLFIIAGVALLIILFIKNTTAIMVVALIGRFCMSAVFAVIILHTSELFPTSNRNSAIGTSLTMAQLGAIVAPFIVDSLGDIAWYIPSTLCGAISILAGLLIFLLPETRNKPLMDTLQDVHAIKSKEKVSWANCFRFS
uniref:Putative synaptic vesicle transporter svop n=2 Tax=Triatoma infestans TaxID=30076 RepID=A0A023F789_TRIIF